MQRIRRAIKEKKRTGFQHTATISRKTLEARVIDQIILMLLALLISLTIHLVVV